jgi:hypothetical protein
LLAFAAASAEAAPISGSFAIGGIVIPVNGATYAGNGNVATGLDFLNIDGSNPSDLGTIGTTKDFTSDGTGSAASPGVPIFALESVSGSTLTFDSEKLLVKYRDANMLALTGSSFFRWAGYDQTPGPYEYTPTDRWVCGGLVAPDAAPTPEPTSLLLLGTGAVLAFRSHRKRQAQIAA